MASPLPKEIERAIFEAIRPILTKSGYKRREKTWYSYTPELLRLFDFQDGYYHPRAYFNVAFEFRSTITTNEHLSVFDCSVHGRLNYLTHEFTPGMHQLGEESVLKKIANISDLLQWCSIPFLDSIRTVVDLQAAHSRGKLKGFTIRKSMRDRFR